MSKKSMEVGFEIVALAGDARTIYLQVLELLKEYKKSSPNRKKEIISEIKRQKQEAENLLIQCHQKQTDLLQSEARGEDADMSYLMVHAQDHLMTTLLLKEILETFLDLYIAG
ncbi:MAG: PTS lactose/cellobiose transporter subunit IIA [Malacoplasma sp.]|nr:PTS lactose/cellobiose transporter subunit IIA [Malacoplasma sp.]